MKAVDTFINCQKCGKRLIERKKSGVWHFAFGKNDSLQGPPVEMFIYGSVKIKCIRKHCGHWNVLNNFPEVESNGAGNTAIHS
jgi:hypothetical protein